MRDWIGAIIASITIVAALTINPVGFYEGDIVSTKLFFAGILLCCAGVAFLIARKIHQLSFSRHVTFWIVGLAVITIGATNMDVLTGTADLPEVASKKAAPAKRQISRYNQETPDVYVPDTLKINRVERLVTQDPNSNSQNENEQLIQSNTSSRDSELPRDWKISDAEKEKFKRFLARQGLKFDPEIAFKRPIDANAAKKTPTNTSTATEQNPASDN